MMLVIMNLRATFFAIIFKGWLWHHPLARSEFHSTKYMSVLHIDGLTDTVTHRQKGCSYRRKLMIHEI